MKRVPESFSLVIPGGWNPQIFRQDWVAKHLLQDPAISQISMMLAVNNPLLPPRIEFEGLILTTNQQVLQLAPKNPNVQELVRAATVCKKILTLLEHTPVNSLGINFGFSEEGDGVGSALNIHVSDDEKLGDAYPLVQTEILRSLKIDESISLNLKIGIREDQTFFEFNFDHRAQDVSTISKLLDDQRIQKHYELATQIIGTVYGQQVQ